MPALSGREPATIRPGPDGPRVRTACGPRPASAARAPAAARACRRAWAAARTRDASGSSAPRGPTSRGLRRPRRPRRPSWDRRGAWPGRGRRPAAYRRTGPGRADGQGRPDAQGRPEPAQHPAWPRRLLAALRRAVPRVQAAPRRGPWGVPPRATASRAAAPVPGPAGRWVADRTPPRTDGGAPSSGGRAAHSEPAPTTSASPSHPWTVARSSGPEPCPGWSAATDRCPSVRASTRCRGRECPGRRPARAWRAGTRGPRNWPGAGSSEPPRARRRVRRPRRRPSRDCGGDRDDAAALPVHS